MLRHPLLTRCVALIALASLVALSACASQARQRARIGQAPYSDQLIWAVAPPRNESGVSIVDELMVSDEFVNAVQNVPGISAVSVNRTLAAMRLLGYPSIEDQEQAIAVARAVGADGIIVPVVTAYDPYEPVKIGVSTALYAVTGRMKGVDLVATSDPKAFQIAKSDRFVLQDWGGPGPVGTFARVYDSADYETQMQVKDYSALHPNPNALGWRIHTRSMRLFTEFACHHTVRELLASEHARINEMVAAMESTQDR